MSKEPVIVTGGIDTHLDTNVAAVIDQTSRVLGVEEFPVEVNRPDRALRHQRHGKNDFVDAEGAARAALSGNATASPKPKDGIVEAIRVVQVAQRSAVKQRTATLNQITNMIVTAPQSLRDELDRLKILTYRPQSSRHHARPSR